jgi:2,3-dihydroxy-p-cumate/2,3-dihydroxybenzoate 3,4-dioxygenase
MAVSDIRYRRLGYIAINVTDLDRSAVFYEDVVGLTRSGEADGAVFFRCSEKHHDIMLVKGVEPGLKRVGWQMESEAALQAVLHHLAELNIAVIPVPPPECATLNISAAYRASEPTTGTTFEFYVDMADAGGGFAPTHTKIARLGHLVIASANRDATGAFMRDELNFRISDKIEDTVIFMRCFPNPFHHSFGVGTGTKSLLNHVNFMVSEIDDIGKAQWRLKKFQSPIVFGPGRHPPSDSVFLYFLDPDGITLEYSFGMEEFPEAEPRAARDMPKGIQSIDYWGAMPEAGFGKIGEIEPLQHEVTA